MNIIFILYIFIIITFNYIKKFFNSVSVFRNLNFHMIDTFK